MELHEALAQISAIREQMARGEVFRGYRAATTAFTGVVAFAAAGAQALWLPDPAADGAAPVAYVLLWVAAAAVSVAVVGAEMTARCIRSSSRLQRQITWLAVDQF